MDSQLQGDLADVVRSSGVGAIADWTSLPTSTYYPTGTEPVQATTFGDPFFGMSDPLLHELPIVTISSSGGGDCMKENSESPSLLQVSRATESASERRFELENFPGKTGIRRRMSQLKKVVCLPAPAPASSPPITGEVVPSDLWAWRKYGQKPIKGSPHPRGYYRCSSSKGCSARKQVERSRADANMLVITYTSEHNHPWPTARSNSLTGSTRLQASKRNVCRKTPNKKPSKLDKSNSSARGSASVITSGEKERFGIPATAMMTDEGRRYKPALPWGTDTVFLPEFNEDFLSWTIENAESAGLDISGSLDWGDHLHHGGRQKHFE